MTHEELLLLGERLRRRRNALGFTQEHVSSEIDISTRYYQMIERGEKSPSLDKLIRISKVLNTSIDYLLFGDYSHFLDDPFMDVTNGLSDRQREDALNILRLYAKACKAEQ